MKNESAQDDEDFMLRICVRDSKVVIYPKDTNTWVTRSQRCHKCKYKYKTNANTKFRPRAHGRRDSNVVGEN